MSGIIWEQSKYSLLWKILRETRIITNIWDIIYHYFPSKLVPCAISTFETGFQKSFYIKKIINWIDIIYTSKAEYIFFSVWRPLFFQRSYPVWKPLYINGNIIFHHNFLLIELKDYFYLKYFISNQGNKLYLWILTPF